jgi:hypothetical protein
MLPMRHLRYKYQDDVDLFNILKHQQKHEVALS